MPPPDAPRAGVPGPLAGTRREAAPLGAADGGDVGVARHVVDRERARATELPARLRAIVARRGEHGLALSGGLREEDALGGREPGRLVLLAREPAGAHHLCGVGVDDPRPLVQPVRREDVRGLVHDHARLGREPDQVLDVRGRLERPRADRRAPVDPDDGDASRRPVAVLVGGDVAAREGGRLEERDRRAPREVAVRVEPVEAVGGGEHVRRHRARAGRPRARRGPDRARLDAGGAHRLGGEGGRHRAAGGRQPQDVGEPDHASHVRRDLARQMRRRGVGERVAPRRQPEPRHGGGERVLRPCDGRTDKDQGAVGRDGHGVEADRPERADDVMDRGEGRPEAPAERAAGEVAAVRRGPRRRDAGDKRGERARIAGGQHDVERERHRADGRTDPHRPARERRGRLDRASDRQRRHHVPCHRGVRGSCDRRGEQGHRDREHQQRARSLPHPHLASTQVPDVVADAGIACGHGAYAAGLGRGVHLWTNVRTGAPPSRRLTAVVERATLGPEMPFT